MKCINIDKITASPVALDMLSPQLAKRMNILPLAFDGETLTVASAISNMNAIQELESLLGIYVECVKSESALALGKAIARYYPESVSGEESDSITALLDQLLNRALQLRASDIHLEPQEDSGQVRFRVDGRLRLEKRLSEEVCQGLISAVKVMANLDIAEKRTPLDGNINVIVTGDTLSLRVATMPTIHGERITLRLLSGGSHRELDQIQNLGMDQEHLKEFMTSLDTPNGIILLSGPTGSGKTTTLYAALRYLENEEKHLISIEDPVESPIAGVSQIRVDSSQDKLSFAKALRGVLRHDPDIIMVGEIRDAETADIAIKSALTGHLVFSTVHTNNAAGVITRMLDLGVSPYLLASTLRLAVAQRLIRQPCEHCVVWSKTRVENLKRYQIDLTEFPKEPIATGCQFCGNTGYAGRIGVYEMIAMDNELRAMIMKNAPEDEISRYVFEEQGKLSLKKDAFNKVSNGLTTLDELVSITLE